MDGSPPIRSRRGELTRSIVLALVLVGVAVAVFILLRPTSPSPPPPGKPTAEDLAAPAALKRAAAALGFKPRTEPGVGSIEDNPASDAPDPSSDLLAVGSKAPLFTLKTPDGKSVSLASLAGKKVMLEFFATWCPHCVAEAPHLSKLARAFGKNVAFVSINADSENAASVYAYHRYFGLPFPALVDPGPNPGDFNNPGGLGRVSAAYHVGTFPTFYVINEDGVITWRNDSEQPDAAIRQALTRTG